MAVNLREQGNKGEDLAVEYLMKKGYRILQRNYRFERGEIDIIAEDLDALVFIEVKSRSSHSFGEPHEAVTVHKREQIRKIAAGYLFTESIDERECRFDIIAIQHTGSTVDIQHFENAF